MIALWSTAWRARVRACASRRQCVDLVLGLAASWGPEVGAGV